jgi:hypothetical protein
MLSGSAASAPAQLQRGACSHTPNGSRSQLFHIARCECSCSHVLTCRYTGRDVVSGPARQQIHQRRPRIRSGRAAFTTVSSSHGNLSCVQRAGSAAIGRMSSCSSTSSGHSDACTPCQLGRCQTQSVGTQRRRSVLARASLDATVQDVLMGSSVAIAIGMALYYGSKVLHAAYDFVRCTRVGMNGGRALPFFCSLLHESTQMQLLHDSLSSRILSPGSVCRGSRRCARGAAGPAACAALPATAPAPWRRRTMRRTCRLHSSARWVHANIGAPNCASRWSCQECAVNVATPAG